MADIKKIEDTLNAALATSGQALGGEINTDEDDMFAEMMAEAEADAEVEFEFE